jgi:hypothetical protein
LRRIKIYQIGKFDSIFSSNEDPIGKENLILRRKILNYMFKDSIRFLKVLIEFIKGLIARKIDS